MSEQHQALDAAECIRRKLEEVKAAEAQAIQAAQANSPEHQRKLIEKALADHEARMQKLLADTLAKVEAAVGAVKAKG